MASFSKRFVGALRLDPATYEEVEADAGALGQAMAVVLIANLAVGIGLGARQGAQGLIGITLASLVTWLIWAAVIWFVGTKILPTPTTSSSIGELLRTTGFALAPGVFRVFSAVPVFGYLIAFIVDVWILAAVVVAVRQALDYTSTWRAVAVCLTGWLLYVFVGFLLVPLTGMPV
jgi:hypothetical protein